MPYSRDTIIRISIGATLLLGDGFNDIRLDKIVVTTYDTNTEPGDNAKLKVYQLF